MKYSVTSEWFPRLIKYDSCLDILLSNNFSDVWGGCCVRINNLADLSLIKPFQKRSFLPQVSSPVLFRHICQKSSSPRLSASRLSMFRKNLLVSTQQGITSISFFVHVSDKVFFSVWVSTIIWSAERRPPAPGAFVPKLPPLKMLNIGIFFRQVSAS